MDDLHSKLLFLPVLEAGSPRTGHKHSQILGEGPLSSCSLLLIVSWHDRERGSKLSSPYKDTNPIMETPPSCITSSSKSPYSQYPMNLGLANIQSMAIALSVRVSKTPESRRQAAWIPILVLPHHRCVHLGKFNDIFALQFLHF